MASFLLPRPAWGFAPHHSSSSSSSSSSSPSKTLIAPWRSSKPFKPSSPAAAAAPEGGGGGGDPPEEAPPDPLKLAFAKAAAYKKAKISSSSQTQEQTLARNRSNDGDSGGGEEAEAPDAAKLAMERAREYKSSRGATNGGGDASVEKLTTNSGQELQTSSVSADGRVDKKVSKSEESKISKIDFLGLEFSEKKRYRGAPPGLAPIVDPFTDGDVREVEIIVGDPTKFENTAPSKVTESEKDDNTGLYKPRVSTWGVFPRPGNISKTYGGGRNIQPGQVLEAAEDRAKKEKRTKELIAAYKSKMGLTIDPKIKAECEKALNEGDKLMGVGKLREALPFYEKVMKDLVFQSELHGMAALQWSVCQDSLSRPNEARVMYEKLQSHPNVQVSKKARQFMFSFQAMEMMKVTSSSLPRTTGYETYFDAFIENKDINAAAGEEQNEDFCSSNRLAESARTSGSKSLASYIPRSPLVSQSLHLLCRFDGFTALLVVRGQVFCATIIPLKIFHINSICYYTIKNDKGSDWKLIQIFLY